MFDGWEEQKVILTGTFNIIKHVDIWYTVLLLISIL